MQQFTSAYETKDCLGEGGFADVYLVKKRSTGELLAAKLFKKLYLREEDYKNEQLVLTTLKTRPHRNLVHLIETFEDDFHLILVQEYVRGGSLLDYLRDKRLSTEREIREIFFQVLNGVQHLHRKGIVHRDLKLENILLTENNEVKIIDFNLATLWSPSSKLQTFCGSLVYSSPEIVLNIPYHGPEADVWSLGVLLFTLLFRCFPFDVDVRFREEKNGRRSIAQQITKGLMNFPINDMNVSEEARSLISRLLSMTNRPEVEEIRECSWLHEEHEKEQKNLRLLVSNNNPIPQLRATILLTYSLSLFSSFFFALLSSFSC